MAEFLWKCRGALGIGVTWGLARGAIYAGLIALIGIVDPEGIDPGERPLNVARIGLVFGFISGVGFSTLLALAERRKALSSLSPGRAALWGAPGTAVFPLVTPVDNSMLVLLCPIGAGLAAASVAAAKRALAPNEERAALGPSDAAIPRVRAN